jgi:RNA-binding protein
MVGDKGLSENVMAEIENALEHHELVKIRLRTDRDSRKEWIRQISDRCDAEKVHVIGQVASFYKRNNKKPVIELPR